MAAYTTIDDPSVYFQTKLYTGTGSSHAVTLDGNSDMQPDWVWIKCRDDSHNNQVFDSVRGVHKRMRTDTTGVETSSTESLKSFDSDGFTVGTQANVNASASGDNSFVAWCWKAGTSVSGTTTGSGTGKAYTGSVSTDAGFSIIKYIGNGTTGHTVPHHLGAVPKMIIIKTINNSAENWFVYHASLGNTQDIHLDNDGAGATADSWNDTTPTSTVWTMSDQSAINSTDGNDHIAYCFAEKQGYSKFGTYTGNGNVNGTFVYTGFKPAFVLLKSYSEQANWQLADHKRTSSGGNVIDKEVRPDLSNVETGGTDGRYIDFLSNGFKPRQAFGNWNSATNTYLYMAFAEQPFVTSTGIPTTAR